MLAYFMKQPEGAKLSSNIPKKAKWPPAPSSSQLSATSASLSLTQLCSLIREQTREGY